MRSLTCACRFLPFGPHLPYYQKNQSHFDAAVAAAKLADVVVLAVGSDKSVEHEYHDRTNITLPGESTALSVASQCSLPCPCNA
jgi:hypothetical protein